MKKILLFAAICTLLAISVYAQADKTVTRGQFTSAIVDREPADEITFITPSEETSVYYFTELNNMQNTTVKHVWSKNGTVVYEMPITVNGPRWRTNSSMRTIQFQPGDVVKVDVIGDDGTVFTSETLEVK